MLLQKRKQFLCFLRPDAGAQKDQKRREALEQKRQQDLEYAQQVLSQQLQQEGGAEMDSLVTNVKKFIKNYGKGNSRKQGLNEIPKWP